MAGTGSRSVVVEHRKETHPKPSIAHDDDGSGVEIRLEIVELVEDDRCLILCSQRDPRSEQDHRRRPTVQQREEGSEVRVARHDDTTLGRSKQQEFVVPGPVRPTSSVWTASWPRSRSSAAIRGERFWSMRNFTQTAATGSHDPRLHLRRSARPR